MSQMNTASQQANQRIQKGDRITLLYGGRSNEREVSFNSGEAIKSALLNLGYLVDVLDPDDTLVERLKVLQPKIVFNGLHGTYGEDGCIQGVLEWLKIPYTGPGVLSSAVAMDKAISRTIFKEAGIPIAEGFTWTVQDSVPLIDQLSNHGPWVFKPIAEGSSVGISRCDTYDQLATAMINAQKSGNVDRWLVESWVTGVEVSVVVAFGEVWGGVEIQPSEGWYDYEAKYQRADTRYYCPPRISQTEWDVLSHYAQLAYQSLCCRGICRVDFITSKDQTVILELNTLPGMTKTSLVPKVAAARGISFDQLIQQMVRAASLDHVSSLDYV